MDINNIPIKYDANQVTDPNTQVSAEEFNALVDAAKNAEKQFNEINKAIEEITATGGASSANAVSFDNTKYGLTSVTVQGAIDELTPACLEVIGVEIINEINIPGSSTTASRLVSFISWPYNRIRIKIDKEIGNISTYNLFTASDNSYNPTLVKIAGNLEFGRYYEFEIEEPQPFIYLFNSTPNADGFVGTIYVSLPNTVKEKLDAVDEAYKGLFSPLNSKAINIPGSSTTASRLALFIAWPYNRIRIKIDKEIGNISTYNLFTASDNSYNPTLVKIAGNLEFGRYYEFEIEEPQPFIYLFNSTPNADGFVGTIYYSIGKSIYESMSNNSWDDMTVVCLGDSITEFQDSVGKSYPDYLSAISGATVINGGIGGTRIAQRTTPVATPSNDMQAYAALDIINVVKAWTSGDWSLQESANDHLAASDDNLIQINRLKNTPLQSVDVVIIMAGTNDFAGGTTIGDNDSSDITTLNGAMNEIMSLLYDSNNNLKIFIATPTVRYLNNTATAENWSDVYTTSSGIRLPDVVEAIMSNAKKWHVPCCDMYWEMGWNKNNFFNYFLPQDTTHPYNGFELIAKKIFNFVNMFV